jgi:SAM-dependent methyltransferase
VTEGVKRRRGITRRLIKVTRGPARRAAAEAGVALLPPWRCPACGEWRKRRRLARCGGVVAAPPHRQYAFATGCPRCGLLYVTPFPPADAFQRLYSAGGQWSVDHHTGTEGAVGDRLLAAVDRLTGIRTPSPGSRALDFGCGHGRWLNTLAGFGWDTYGLDPAIKTAFVRHTEVRTLAGPPQYRFVVLSHVLEHLAAPGAVLAAVSRVIEPGGWLYVAVPGLDALAEHRDWKYILNARTHITAYSFACLSFLLHANGFGTSTRIEVKGDRKAGARLRIVAQKSGAGTPPPNPLDAAYNVLRAAGLLLETRPDGAPIDANGND